VVITESACRALLAISSRWTTTLYVSTELSVSPVWAAVAVEYKLHSAQSNQELMIEAPDYLLGMLPSLNRT